MSFENFPYSNFHELNLDWIIQKLKEAYSAENPPDFPVKSVNGMTGDVIIAIPSNFVQSVNGETGDVVLYRNPLTQFPATDETRWNLFRICDGTEKGIEFDTDSAKRISGTRRILIYDEDNPPDYPVTSVNGQTGDVQITAGVQSVNGKTGNVVTPFVNPNTDILTLDSSSPSILWGISRNVPGGNVALYITTGGANPQAFIRYIPDGGQAINLPLLTNADIPDSAGVVSVNTKTGAVTLYGTDILLSADSSTNIIQALNGINQNIDNITNSIYNITPGTQLTWTQGYYNPTNGASIDHWQYIKSEKNTMDQYDIIKSKNNIVMILQAWENDTYIGVYKENEDTFSPASTFSQYIYTSFDIKKLKNEHPSYQFSIVARFDPFSAISPTNAEYIDFYKLAIDVTTELAETVNTHSQQISALQTKDNTQDQQISALQTTSNSYSQQIAELYTRIGTGIKEVTISEIVTLPARYPTTGLDNEIKSTSKCMLMELSRPGVQHSDWTIETFDGYLTITGTIRGLTDITLYLI